MKHALAWAGSAILPVVVAGPVFVGMIAGGNEDLEGWLRAAAMLLLPASLANVIAAWAVALRRGASPPRNTWGALLRGAACFALALPIYFVLVALIVLLQGEQSGWAFAIATVAGMMAALIGTLPMIALQWLLFHFTLPRATA